MGVARRRAHRPTNGVELGQLTDSMYSHPVAMATFGIAGGTALSGCRGRQSNRLVKEVSAGSLVTPSLCDQQLRGLRCSRCSPTAKRARARAIHRAPARAAIATALRPQIGSSHSRQASSSRITGIRLCSSLTVAFAAVVTTAAESSHWPVDCVLPWCPQTGKREWRICAAYGSGTVACACRRGATRRSRRPG